MALEWRTELPGSTRGEVGVNKWWHSQSRDKYGCRFLQPESQVWEQVLIHHVWWIGNKQPEISEMDCHQMFVEVQGAWMYVEYWPILQYSIFPKGQMLVASPHSPQLPLTHEFPPHPSWFLCCESVKVARKQKKLPWSDKNLHKKSSV